MKKTVSLTKQGKQDLEKEYGFTYKDLNTLCSESEAIFLALNKSPEELGLKDHNYFVYDSSDNFDNSNWRSTIDANNWQNNGSIVSKNSGAGLIGNIVIRLFTKYSLQSKRHL